MFFFLYEYLPILISFVVIVAGMQFIYEIEKEEDLALILQKEEGAISVCKESAVDEYVVVSSPP